VFSALETFSRLVAPLSEARRAAYYQEGKRFAELFGVTEDVMPPDHAAFEAYWSGMLAGRDLAVGSDADDLAPDILAPKLAGTLRPFGRLARPLSAALLPDRLRKEYGLGWGTVDRALYGAIEAGTRTAIRALPAPVRYWPHFRVAERRVAAGGNEGGQSSVIQ